MRLCNKSILIKYVYKLGINYYSPSNFNYWWNLGSLALVCLIIQMITGLFLSMHYNCDINLAFITIEHISRDVQYGWVMRYMHLNGGSLFFIVVYLHMLKGIMFGSYTYPRQMLWVTGVIIFILMITTSFVGYVLPWGQMSFWAVTVITSLLEAVPVIGTDMLLWLWGGFSVDSATLSRFYSFHFFFPFLIVGLTIIHLVLLHEFGSNNPLGIVFRYDGISFTPYYLIKDFLGIIIMFLGFSVLLFQVPNMLGHPDNYIFANQLVTPIHIVPEWYFLPLYAILRSLPNKLLGLIVLLCAILALLFLPYLSGSFNLIRSIYFKPLLKYIIGLIIVNSLVLGWVGGQFVISPYYQIGQLSTCLYFILLLSIPVINFVEYTFLYNYSKNNKW